MSPEPLPHGSGVAGPAGSGGFTLLEVMAAVAVMGMLFITLARTNIQGIIAESSAARRMEAARLADRKMQEIEMKLEAGTLPLEVGISEEEEPPYTIEIELALFELDLPALPNELTPGGGSEGELEPVSAFEALETAIRKNELLRRIQVRVLWDEGTFQRRVTRTTFGYDPALLQISAQMTAPAVPGAGGNPNQPTPERAELTEPRAPDVWFR